MPFQISAGYNFKAGEVQTAFKANLANNGSIVADGQTYPFSAGTSLAPSITFTGDTGTGFYSSSAGVVGLTGALSGNSSITATQFISNVATGTAPFTVVSTTNVPNLNASSLGGATFASPGTIGSGTAGAATFTTANASRFVSTIATGTAPFSVTSTTNVANLNASSLNGATFAAPGAIGSGTASSGAFSTLSVNGFSVTVNGSSTLNQDVHTSATPTFVGANLTNSFWRGTSAVAVSTLATTILTLSSATNMALCLVAGDNGINGFVDLVLYGFGANPIVVSSNTGYGAPAARTYSQGSNSLKCQVVSGTFNVRTAYFGPVT